jgi:hypothetical protein
LACLKTDPRVTALGSSGILGLGERQTRNRIAAAEAATNNTRILEAGSLNAALKEIGHHGYRPSGTPKRSWHEPVKQTLDKVDTDTLNARRDLLNRHEERETERKLALQLIDIGYKALATKLPSARGRQAAGRREVVI